MLEVQEGSFEAHQERRSKLGHAQVHIRSTVPRSSCRICNCSLELVAVIEISVTPREQYQMRNVLFVISGETKKHISGYVHVQSACLTCACERFLSTARSVQRFGLQTSLQGLLNISLACPSANMSSFCYCFVEVMISVVISC